MNNSPNNAGFLKEINSFFEKIANYYESLDTGIFEVADYESDIRLSNFKMANPIWWTSNLKFYQFL